MLTSEDRNEFTVAEVARACNVSRTTLIHLEECGFLKPSRVNPVTGYRYYDSNNILDIGRYKRLQSLGFTRNEITDIYNDREDSREYVESKRKHLRELQLFINEYDLSRAHTKEPVSSLLSLPEASCYCEDISSASFERAELTSLGYYKKVISSGFRVIPEQPPIVLADDWTAIASHSPSGCHLTVCIPVIPDPSQLKDPHLRFFPGSEAFSVSGFGEYSILSDLFSHFFTELSERNLETSGPVRLIVLNVNKTAPGKYLYECVVPVKGHPVL